MKRQLWEYPFGPILNGVTAGWARVLLLLAFAYLGLLLAMCLLFGLGPLSTSTDTVVSLFVLTPFGLLALLFLNLASTWGLAANLGLIIAPVCYMAYERRRMEMLFVISFLTGSSMLVFAQGYPWQGLTALAPMVAFVLLLGTPYAILKLIAHRRMQALEQTKASDFDEPVEFSDEDTVSMEFDDDDGVGYWPSEPAPTPQAPLRRAEDQPLPDAPIQLKSSESTQPETPEPQAESPSAEPPIPLKPIDPPKNDHS